MKKENINESNSQKEASSLSLPPPLQLTAAGPERRLRNKRSYSVGRSGICVSFDDLLLLQGIDGRVSAMEEKVEGSAKPEDVALHGLLGDDGDGDGDGGVCGKASLPPPGMRPRTALALLATGFFFTFAA